MTKKLAGRPTKLVPAMREQTIDYLRDCADNKKVPSHARLAVVLGVNKSTLYEWAKNDEAFSNTLKDINTLQEATLVEGGLENKYNSTIVKLMLSNHGYSDKQEQTHTFTFNEDNKTRKYIDAED